MAYQASASEKEIIKGLVSQWREAKTLFSNLVMSRNDNQLESALTLIYSLTSETLDYIKFGTAQGENLDWMPIDRILENTYLSNVYMEAIEEKYCK